MTTADSFRSTTDGRRLEHSMQIGLVALRWALFVWMLGVMVFEIYSRANNELPQVPHPYVGLALIGAAGLFTIAASIWLKTSSQTLLTPIPVAIELVLGGALLFASDWIWQDVSHSQNVASMWPVCGAVAAGVAFGVRTGAAAGAALGIAGYFGIPLNGGDLDWAIGRTSTVFFLALCGWTAAYLVRWLRHAEEQIANAQAREEVARTLHDGVLQTLAVIQRRSDDHELAAMARDQESELRLFLSGAATNPETFAAQLRQAATRHERNHDVSVQLITADDLEEPPAAHAEAVAKAVGEALTNSAKHGKASHVTIYVEPDFDGGIFCSVKDDGIGFIPDTITEGIGLSRSIRGRVEEIGGRVELASRPGRGTEVRIWTQSPTREAQR